MDIKAEKLDSCFPPPGVTVLVQCQGFRCLGYRAHDGKWLSAFSHQELENVVQVYPLDDPKEMAR